MLSDTEIARYRPFMEELGIDRDLALYLHNAMGLIVAEEIHRSEREGTCEQAAVCEGANDPDEVQSDLKSLKKIYNDAA